MSFHATDGFATQVVDLMPTNSYLLPVSFAVLAAAGCAALDEGGIIWTKLSGKTPLFPLRVPASQPASSSSDRLVIMSPTFNDSSSGLCPSYSNVTRAVEPFSSDPCNQSPKKPGSD